MRNRKEKIRFESSVASSQTAVDRAPKNDGSWNGEQRRAETDLIPFHFTVFRDIVRRDKAMKCSRITQKDDSTFSSLKLIRETGAKLTLTFPRAVSCKSRGRTVSPSLPFRFVKS